MNNLPLMIDSGAHGKFHVQGICLDDKHEYIYLSFTTALLKMDLQGNLIGSVHGLTGHLGCIGFNSDDGRVYGSLEYKNDAIGRGILKGLGKEEGTNQNRFYIAIFDVDKIDRPDMDAAGIMTTVNLNDVVADYEATVEHQGKTVEHRYGCSGIDGMTFAPIPGAGKDAPRDLFVAYGVYSDLDRTDNDYQVIHRYNIANWDKLAKPLTAENPHTSGPEKPDSKYFVLTGNTEWGVQNMEYDPATGNILLAVYPGHKPQYKNPPMFVIDGSVAPRCEKLQGVEPDTQAEVLTLWGNGTDGYSFPHGSTGIYAFGDGRFYFSEHYRTDEGLQGSKVYLYRYTGQSPDLFEKV